MKKEDNEHIILRWQLMWFRISLIADNFVKFAEKAHMRWDVPEPSQKTTSHENKKEVQK